MRIPSLKGPDVVRGMLIYPVGDTAAALLTGGFSPLRLAGMMVVGGLVYAWEIPAWFRWINAGYTGAARAAMAVLYFNPLWIARHLAFICLLTGRSPDIAPGLLLVSLKGFAVNLPVAFAVNYLIQNRTPLKWRFTASAAFSALLAVYYPLCRVIFK